MRKLTVIFMALMLCLQVFSGAVAFAAGEQPGNYISISGTRQSVDEDITKGMTFMLFLNCRNTADSAITDVTAEVRANLSFSPVDSVPTPLFDTLAKDGISHESEAITLKYDGKGNTAAITLHYTIGTNEYVQTISVNVTGVDEDSGNSSSNADPADFKPRLEITNSSNIPSIKAGSTQKLTYPIKNNSIYQARNIDVSLKMVDETKAPLVLDNFNLRQSIDYINGNETKEVSFDLSVLSSAPEGLYPLKLSYDFENAYNIPISTSETVYVRVSNDNASPKLNVDSVTVRQNAGSSDAILLDISLKNLGKASAKDIKITLQGLKSGGFTTDNSTDVKYVEKIGGGAAEIVTYKLRMPTSGAAGSNELTVKMDYSDMNGVSLTEQNQIFVPAGEGEGSRPEISFEKIVSPQSALGTGDDFTVGFELKNNSGAVARNVKVSLTVDAALVVKSMNPVYVDKLGANSGKNVSFKLFAADDAVTKNYPVAINVEYEDVFGTKYTATQYIGAYVEGSGSSKSVPRIIVDNYSMEPFPVNAGEDFKLKMSFLNTSGTMDVSNIKVTVASDDGTFTPTDSGNTFFIEGIASKQNVERELLLHVKPDAEQKSYMLTVDFEYEDSKGNPFTAKETMSVRVLQNPRLTTGELNLAPEAFVGQPVQFYLDFYNMGKSTLYNLMVKLEGDFDGQNLSYYVGNFESGRTDFFDVSAMPKAVGQQKGSVLFTFEDANGKKTEIRKEFSMNVSEMAPQGPMVDGNGMPVGKDGMVIGPDGKPIMGAGPTKPSIWIYIGGGAGLLVLAAIVFIILRRRHNRRKEMSLDE